MRSSTPWVLTRYINLNIFYTDVEHSPTKAIYIKYYTHTHTQKHALHTHTHIFSKWGCMAYCRRIDGSLKGKSVSVGFGRGFPHTAVNEGARCLCLEQCLCRKLLLSLLSLALSALWPFSGPLSKQPLGVPSIPQGWLLGPANVRSFLVWHSSQCACLVFLCDRDLSRGICLLGLVSHWGGNCISSVLFFVRFSFCLF